MFENLHLNDYGRSLNLHRDVNDTNIIVIPNKLATPPLLLKISSSILVPTQITTTFTSFIIR